MAEELAKGFTCECGKEHKYPAYVFAHWRVELVFTCPECQRKYDIYAGTATLKK